MTLTQDELDRIIRTARAICFARCSAGEFLDPENGCVSVCKSAEECQGWRTFVGDADRQR